MSISIIYRVEVYDSGTVIWRLGDKLHRVNGPAIEGFDGTKQWYLNGDRHRIDGPAYEREDGVKAWYLHGKEMSEEEHRQATSPVKELTVAEVEALLGYPIKIVK